MKKIIRSSLIAVLFASTGVALASFPPPIRLLSGEITGTTLNLFWSAAEKPENLQYAWLGFNKGAFEVKSAQCQGSDLKITFKPLIGPISTMPILQPPLIHTVKVRGKLVHLCG